MPLALPSREPHPLAAGLYSTDAFHRRPLFVVAQAPSQPDKPARVVRSWEEAHALHGPASISDVNPAYVAALIGQGHNAHVAPYKRIHRLPRAHHVLISTDGRVHTSAYDPLAGGAAPMEADTLHQVLRQGLLDHVGRVLQGHTGPVGCEHSSGLDSNAVLGALVHGLHLKPEQLHTWSREFGGEETALPECRRFHGLLPEQCHRESAIDPWQHDPEIQMALGAPPQLGCSKYAVRSLHQQGCTVLLSGLGGDQALSHSGANVPTDLVAQGRWAELVHWMGGRRSALRTGASRALALASRSWAERKVLLHNEQLAWSNLLVCCLSAEGRSWLIPHVQQHYPWEFDPYLFQHQSIRRRVLADWVAVRAEEESRYAAAFGMTKAFPLLDERLIACLLQQDPILFGEGAGRGRLLHRRAFAPFLPPMLRKNPSKKREPDGGLIKLRKELVKQRCDGLERTLAGSAEWHPDVARLWDLAAIRQEVERILIGTEPTLEEVFGMYKALTTLEKLSHWWQALDG